MAEASRNNLGIYDDVAEQWWSDEIKWVRTLKNMVPARLKWFERHIHWRDKSVLDLGCAGGFMAEALATRGALVTGIDPAADAIRAATRHAMHTKKDIRYEVGIGEALPYEDASFDAVVCVDVLEHVADVQQVLCETARVLKPGGIFLFDTINRNILARLAVVTMGEDILRLLPKGTHDPDLFIKPQELKVVIENAGLETGQQTGLGPVGLDWRGEVVFGRLPFKLIIYMGVAYKPEVSK